jgi:hypothetical protein
MKKTLLAATVALGLMAGQADAFTLDGDYKGPVKLVMGGFTTTDDVNSVATTWGVFSISSILNDAFGTAGYGSSLWSQSGSNFLLGGIWGLTDAGFEDGDFGMTNYLLQGGSFAIYETTALPTYTDLVSNLTAASGNVSGALTSLFTSQAVLSGDFTKDVLPGAPSGTTMTSLSNSQYTNQYAYGGGEAYLDVTGGTQQSLLDSTLDGTDLHFEYSFQGNKNSDIPWGASLTSASATGTAVPEPGTMVLLGFGMFGLAIFGKRRMDSKKA